jgi:hypothetical protein
MPYETITLSSANVPGASAAANLNWTGGRPVSVAVTMPSTTGGVDWTLQISLQDYQRLGVGSSQVTWFNYGSSGLAIHYSSANLDVGGVGPTFTFLGAVAAIRLNSTAMSSGPLSAFILQGEGG